MSSKSNARRKVAIYPGSFDPVTRGHLDIVQRALRIFDGLTIGILDNSAKRAAKEPLFTVGERVKLIEAELAGVENVRVVPFAGLAVELAASVGAAWIVRGVRSATDVADELPMALSNRLCGAEPIETVFLAASPEVSFVASRLVREIAAGGGRLDAFVTPAVARALREK